MSTLPVADIKVGKRHRRDLGDIAALAESLVEVGLLHPVVVTADHRLVAGARRLAAAKQLGWDEIDVTVAANLSEAATLLRAESDENTCRKDFTATEAESLASAREALLAPMSKPGPKSGDPAKFAPSGETRKVAATGTGLSHTSIRKVREVKQVAADESKPEPVRETAKQALAEMDATGNVDRPYRKVRAATAPADPISEAKQSAAAAPANVGAKAIDKIRDALRIIDAAGGTDAIVTDLSTAPLGDTLAATWLPDLEQIAESSKQWAAALRRRSLRSVQ